VGRLNPWNITAAIVAESLLLNQGTPAQKVERSRLAERLLLTPVKANK
jgi:hypothetical protein